MKNVADSVTTRYIAGIMPGNPVAYSILAKLEEVPAEEGGEPTVLAIYTLIDSMSREQAEHLHLQLTNVLGFAQPVEDTTPEEKKSHDR